MASDRDQPPPANAFEVHTLRMSKADVRIMTECRSEAFRTRGLPLMIGFSTLTHFLVKTKKLSPHPSYGSFFKVVWAAFFGNILGKISYQSRCNDKLTSDPNSLLGRSILERRGITPPPPTDPDVIDIIARANDAAVLDDQTKPAPGSYDEMRRRNRLGLPPLPPPGSRQLKGGADDHDDNASVGLPPVIGRLPEREEVPPEERPMNRRMPVPKRNKYGDVIEDD